MTISITHRQRYCKSRADKFYDQRNHEDALSWYKKSLFYYKQIIGNIPYPPNAGMCIRIAYIYIEYFCYTKAEKYFRMALAIWVDVTDLNNSVVRSIAQMVWNMYKNIWSEQSVAYVFKDFLCKCRLNDVQATAIGDIE